MPKVLRGVIAAFAVSALLAPTPAFAERWAGGDPAGDVTGGHYDPEPEPCGTDTELDASADTNHDIRRLVVRHTRTDVRLIARFRDLDPALEQSVSFHIATKARRGWFLHIDRFKTPAGKVRVMGFLAREPRLSEPEDLDECEGLAVLITGLACRTRPRVDLDANEVRATIPRSCLKNPRWVRVGVRADGWNGSDDPADTSWDYFSDEWDAPGTSTSIWLPPFGPKVRAARGAQLAAPMREATAPSREVRRSFVVSPSWFVRWGRFTA